MIIQYHTDILKSLKKITKVLSTFVFTSILIIFSINFLLSAISWHYCQLDVVTVAVGFPTRNILLRIKMADHKSEFISDEETLS